MCLLVAAAAAMRGEYKEKYGDDVDPVLFLDPTEKECLDAMNKPYNIKRYCRVKDETEAFIAGEIQSEYEYKVTIKTTKNNKRRTKAILCLRFGNFYIYEAENSLIYHDFKHWLIEHVFLLIKLWAWGWAMFRRWALFSSIKLAAYSTVLTNSLTKASVLEYLCSSYINKRI